MPKGNTFLSEIEKSPSGVEVRHLRIVITNPDANGDQVVVSITTDRGFSTQDRSCVLNVGDHPFITHTSLVDFARTRTMTFTEVFNGIQKGILIRKEDVNPVILEKIITAAKDSNRIPQRIKQMID